MKFPMRFTTRLVQSSIWLKWQSRDWVRKNGLRWISYMKYVKYILLKNTIRRDDLSTLFAAHRYYQTSFMTNRVCQALLGASDHLETFVDAAGFAGLDRVARRTIVLKNPEIREGRIEKGVLLITFTETFPFFYQHIDCERLLKYFYVVLEPSWAGYCDANILFWMKYKPSPVVVEASEIQDFRFLESLGSNLIPVSFGASDWVDFRIFNPVPSEKKTYDSIYVTNYHPIKRHHVFFKALREIGDPTYSAALAFGQNGDAKQEIGQLIDYYNIRNNVTIYERLPQQQLNTILSKAKVNVLLSLKEGSNRSIFEALFTNLPGIVLKNNVGVNKSYINEMTGRLIDESELAQVLQEFRTSWEKYSPREWALKNISPLVTTRKLSETLQKCARERGELWSKDLAPKINAPEVEYFYAETAGSMLKSRKVIELFLNERHRATPNDHELHQHLIAVLPSNQSSQAVSSSQS